MIPDKWVINLKPGRQPNSALQSPVKPYNELVQKNQNPWLLPQYVLYGNMEVQRYEVIDSSDRERIEEAHEELWEVWLLKFRIYCFRVRVWRGLGLV